MPEPTFERIDGPTPNGGAYAMIYYKDQIGAPCGRSAAFSAEIVEFSQDDQYVFTTQVYLGKANPNLKIG